MQCMEGIVCVCVGVQLNKACLWSRHVIKVVVCHISLILIYGIVDSGLYVFVQAYLGSASIWWWVVHIRIGMLILVTTEIT